MQKKKMTLFCHLTQCRSFIKYMTINQYQVELNDSPPLLRLLEIQKILIKTTFNI